MNQRKLSKLKSYQVTNDYLTANEGKVSGLPNYSTYKTTLSENIPKLLAFSANQSGNITGISDEKNVLKQQVGTLAYDTSTRLVAYARQNQLPTLLKEAYFTESTLKRGADATVRDSSRNLYNLAEPLLEQLAPFGITAETQTALNDAIEAFAKAIPVKRTVVNERQDQSSECDRLFDETDEALKQIDTLVDMIRQAEPDFYVGYRGARMVLDTRTEIVSVKGEVVEAETLVPVTGANIELMLLPVNGHAPVTKKSAEKGGFRIKSMTPGNYQMKVSKYGYTEQVLDVAVNSGETTKLTITLAKN